MKFLYLGCCGSRQWAVCSTGCTYNGVVGYQQRGNALFLQSGGQGLRVLTQQNTPVEVGDLVDVLGFPAMGDSAPMLEDAIFHRLGHEKAPEPLRQT